MQFQRGRTDEPARPGAEVCATEGDVLIDNQLSAEGVSVNGAMFPPGAHTFWHSHEQGQIFFITSGEGVIASRNGQFQIVRAGDVVHTPPGEEHFHGAAPDSFVTYTSISLGKTSFAEPVEPRDYDQKWEGR